MIKEFWHVSSNEGIQCDKNQPFIASGLSAVAYFADSAAHNEGI